MNAMNELINGMAQGRTWSAMGDGEAVRALLGRVYNERYHRASHHRDRFQLRVNLQKKDDAASYAGWITSENPTSGPYQGTSFVWFSGVQGSVAVLVIGTDGFGADTAILGRPGHARRLRAISRLHRGKIIPNTIAQQWPDISAALKAYTRVIYAAVSVRSDADGHAVEDLIDLFFHEHGTPLTGDAKKRWERRLEEIAGAVFPAVTLEEVLATLRERRFLVLEGPPGTGKTRLAYKLANLLGHAQTTARQADARALASSGSSGVPRQALTSDRGTSPSGSSGCRAFAPSQVKEHCGTSGSRCMGKHFRRTDLHCTERETIARHRRYGDLLGDLEARSEAVQLLLVQYGDLVALVPDQSAGGHFGPSADLILRKVDEDRGAA
jgi:hypothetical protein